MSIYRRISVGEATAVLDVLSDMLEGYPGLDDPIEEAISIMNDVITQEMSDEELKAFANKFIEMCGGDPSPEKITDEARQFAFDTFKHDPQQMITAQRFVEEEMRSRDNDGSDNSTSVVSNNSDDNSTE